MKPGFFQNEQLAELPVEARLLYIGLWCMADREGRLEDRPKRIKMQIFPADTIDVEPLLSGLEQQGLIERYESGGIQCVEIPKFLEHQRPHHNETPSKLPPRLEGLAAKVESCACQGDNNFVLNPSSLNPDSLNPPNPPKGGLARFDEFWRAYPKRVGKAAARRAWSRKKLDGMADTIIEHLQARVRSDAQWLAEDGKFIPNPATWLNRDGWDDEYKSVEPADDEGPYL